jgi:hypothetical protein
LHLLAVSRLTSPAKMMLSTLEAAACSWSLTLAKAVYSRGRSDYSLYMPPIRKRVAFPSWEFVSAAAVARNKQTFWCLNPI